jgi:hypothetical protein
MSSQKIGNLGVLKDVLFVREVKSTLISVKKLCDDGFRIVMEKDAADILKDNVIIARAELVNGLYQIRLSDLGIIIPTSECAFLSTSRIEINNDILHLRTGHVSENLVSKASRCKSFTGMNYSHSITPNTCEACLRAKAHKTTNRREVQAIIPRCIRNPMSSQSTPLAHSLTLPSIRNPVTCSSSWTKLRLCLGLLRSGGYLFNGH